MKLQQSKLPETSAFDVPSRRGRFDGGNYFVSASSADTTPPVVNLRSVSGSTLIMTLNETLKSTVPDSARFAVHVNGATRSVISRSVNTTGRTVTLGLATPVTAGQAVTLAYTDKTSGNDTTGVIEDVAGNDLRTFTATAVTNNTPPADTTPPVVVSMRVNGATLIMTLNETLKGTLPDLGRFNVLVNNSGRSVVSRSVNTVNKTVTLGLSSPVTAGQAVQLKYTDKTTPGNDLSGVIEDRAGNDLHRACAVIAPLADPDFCHAAAPGGEQGAVPAEQAVRCQRLFITTGCVQHDLDDPLDIAVLRGQRADVDPEATRDLGPHLCHIKHLALDLARLDDIHGQGLQDGFLAQLETERFHSADKTTLIMPHRRQRCSDGRVLPDQLWPGGIVPDVHSHDLRNPCGDHADHSPRRQVRFVASLAENNVPNLRKAPR